MLRRPTRGELNTYKQRIMGTRLSPSSRTGRSLAEEAASDRSRILYSSAFRRLQQKTQVFSLEKNAAVRSRLTHSLEVSNVGRLIAHALTRDFLSDLDDEQAEALTLTVETGCLMHDIGNPPFGHFAEVAIQQWFDKNWQSLFTESVRSLNYDENAIATLCEDFRHFDGNPQGIRIATRLQGLTTTERARHGMNLTFAQLLTSVKYPYTPTEVETVAHTTKPGYFESERYRMRHAESECGLASHARFPLSYIVEAADDISYTLSDIEDGIDNGALRPSDFFAALLEQRDSMDHAAFEPFLDSAENAVERTGPVEQQRDEFLVFKTLFTPALVTCAVTRYEERHEKVLEGSLVALFETEDEERILFDLLRTLAGRFLYSSNRVEQPLRVGLSVVGGILDHFKRLLRLSQSEMDDLAAARESGDRSKIRKARHDPELLVFNLLPTRYVDTYKYERSRVDTPEWEWSCRAHLVLDYLSGMTDDYALRTYHTLAGVDYD